MAPVREVAFELECFEWADERLEVAGRWRGLGTRRMNRPVLTLETESGRRKRVVAMPGGHVGVTGEIWRASFAWPADPADITGAALEVGGQLVVDLPLPDRKRRRRRRSNAEQSTDESVRLEVGALRGQIDRLRAELAGREREIIALRSQLDEDTDDEPELERSGAEERTVEIQRLAGELDRLRDENAAGVDAMTVEIQRLARERDEARAEREEVGGTAAADRVRWQSDLDELREAFSDAAAEAETARDQHRAQLAALEEELRAERADAARLAAELADRDAAPPPTQPMPPPTEPEATGSDAASPEPTATEEEPVRSPGSEDDTVAVEAAVLDAPGPMRAGARPPIPPGAEDQPDVTRTPAWLRGASAERPLQALRDRFEGLFGTNGRSTQDEPAEEEAAVPRPRRTAAAARARAGATVAARRTPTEVWGVRMLAALLVAVLLVAFVLILASVA